MEFERVQYIASNLSKESETTIPSDYIRSEKEQPAITTLHGVVLEVPVIDLRNDEKEENLVRLVSQASREWGIFQVVNHGIPEEVITKLQEVGKYFFEVIPQEEKEEIAKPIGGFSKTIEGYGTSLQKDGKKGWVDHLFHIIWPPSSVNYKFWPKNPPSYREANEEYCKRLRGVSDRLFKYLSLGIGLEENEFKESLGGEELIYLMKINYYPPCPRPDLVLGVAPHTDASSFTILVPNEIQGLQVFKNDNWYDVKYIPNALIVHIGDQIEIISNGKYKSVLHRTTVNKEKTRMSWPVFLEPPPEKEIGPNPKLVDEDEEKKKKKEEDNGGKIIYKTKKYKDYLYCKLNKIPQ